MTFAFSLEYSIYGLGREGMLKLPGPIDLDEQRNDTILTRRLDRRQYELNDHLGNVRAVLSDRKLSDVVTGQPPAEFRGEIVAYNNVYPYGMEQPLRYTGSDLYRYGYNGMEKDSAVTGEHYTTYFRQYDARLERWWSIDPVWHRGESPYMAMGDNPVGAIDPSGADTVHRLPWVEVTAPPFAEGLAMGAVSTWLTYDQQWGAKPYLNSSYWNELDTRQRQQRAYTAIHDNEVLNEIGSAFKATKYVMPGLYYGVYITAGFTVGMFEVIDNPLEYAVKRPLLGLWELNKATNPLYWTIDPAGAIETQQQFSQQVIHILKNPQPIDLNKFDIDYWIESDVLFQRFGPNLRANPEFRKILSETPGFEGLKPNKQGFSIKFKSSTGD